MNVRFYRKVYHVIRQWFIAGKVQEMGRDLYRSRALEPQSVDIDTKRKAPLSEFVHTSSWPPSLREDARDADRKTDNRNTVRHNSIA